MMRILALFLIWFIVSAGVEIPTRRILQQDDGTLAIKIYAENSRLHGETDLQMMDRIDAEQGEVMPKLIDVQKDDIPADRSERHKWRVKTQGNRKLMWVDPSAPDTARIIAQKAKKAKKDSARGKLKAMGLTNEELDAIIPGDAG